MVTETTLTLAARSAVRMLALTLELESIGLAFGGLHPDHEDAVPASEPDVYIVTLYANAADVDAPEDVPIAQAVGLNPSDAVVAAVGKHMIMTQLSLAADLATLAQLEEVPDVVN